MTEVLTVPTHFGDISELSAGLADRVDEERLILYGPDAFEEGSTVGFAVLLMDGSPALEGFGRVTAAVDGGEERAPETRYDIVFDSLQLQGMSEVVYERIILARQSMMGDDPATGEISLDELEQSAEAEVADVAFDDGGSFDDAADAAFEVDDVGDAVPAEPAHDGASDWDADATAVADAETMAELAEDAGAAAATDDLIAAAEVDPVEPELGSPVDEGAVVADPSAVAEVSFDDDDVALGDPAVGEAALDDVVFDGDASLGEGAFDDDEPVAADAVSSTDDDFGDEPWASDAAPSASEPPPSPSMAPRDSLGPPPEDPPIAPSPELPPAPVGFQIPPFEGRLMRPTHPPTWQPEAEPAELSAESTGFFAYAANDLPVPASAPRPDDLDRTLRVQPAPRPGDEAPQPNGGGGPGSQPPQIPLPGDDADVAPAVEPDSFAIEDDAAIQEASDAFDADDLDERAPDVEDVELEAADVEDAGLDEEVSMDALVSDSDEFDESDAIAFEEDDRV